MILALLIACMVPVGPATAASAAAGSDAAPRVAARADSAKKAPGKNAPEFKPGEVIVRYAPKASLASKRSADRRSGAAEVTRLGSVVPGLSKVKLKKGVSVKEAVAAYNKQPGVLYAEPNYIGTTESMPDDPMLGSLWGLDNTGQDGGVPDADIDAPEAWDTTTGSSDVVVAVIDTGVDYTHPDLAANMWTNPGEIAGNGIDDEGNGFVDDVYGIDTINGDSDPMDDFGHGTHCAGTIGAEGNNGIGVVGVNWNVRIMAVKWIGADGWGYTDGAIAAIEYAHAMGADVTSNSWHVFEYSQALYDTIAAADGLHVFAAGNESMNTDVWVNHPSAYDLPNILAVGASNRFDEMAWFSNYGLKTVDVFAPGEDILSTVPGESYEVYSGTSMATPHVAGVAALLLSTTPTASWQDLKLAIMGSSDKVPAFAGKCLSGGRLNADLALDAIAGAPGTLTGTVTSAGGEPVAGAQVAIGSTLYATTGLDGRYTIAESVPGAQSVVCSHPDYLTKVTSAEILPGGTTTLDIQLDLAGKIAGTVTAASSGLPIEGIQVTAYGSGGGWWEPVMSGVTGPDGTYLIGGLAPDPIGYRIEFSDPSMNYVSEFYDDKSTVEMANEVYVDYGFTTPNIDAVLQEYGRITGTVTAESDGAPLGGVWITAYRQTGEWWEPIAGSETAADGTYSVGGLETGTYRVEFDDPYGEYAYEYYDDVTMPAKATPVDVLIGSVTPNIDAALGVAGKISGTVTAAADGEPLGEIFIGVYRNMAGTWEPMMMGVVTAPDGTYTLGGLPSGVYRVEFNDWNGTYANEFYAGKPNLRSATAVAVKAGSITENIDATLDLSGKIAGTVTAADGTPLEAVWVTAYRKIGKNWEWVNGAETGPDGSYAVEGLATGTYRVEFAEPSGAYASEFYDAKPTLDKATNVSVTAGLITTGIDATLDPAGMISGTVTAASDGAPLGGISAIAYRNIGGSWQAYFGADTAEDGTYTIGGLPAGTYRVEFIDWMSGTYAGEFYDDVSTLAAATDISVTLGSTTPGIDAQLDFGGHITGTVTSASDGLPIADVWVTVFRDNGGIWEPFNGGTTGPDGTYTVGGLATGTYRVEFFDGQGLHAVEYYDNQPTLKRADNVSVTAGSETQNIDAVLDPISGGGRPAVMSGATLPLGSRFIRGLTLPPGIARPAAW